MKKTVALLLLIPTLGFSQINILDEIKKAIPIKLPTPASTISSLDISNGLKEALQNGITKQVTKLTSVDGFYKNTMVKILLPDELQKVDKTLRKIGLSALADKGILLMNRAAEDAVKESTPIFVVAVKNMSFSDAKSILMGNDNSATTYLQSTTTTPLYAKFNPVIQNSFAKVGADKVWASIIKKYNTLPLVKKVNPDLTEYTTNRALEGVFKMIAVEEIDIRTNLKARTSTLLQNVFGLQDKK